MEELLHIRPVTIEDAEMLFEWRNDKEARRNSRHVALIGREEHKQWFEKSVHGDFPGRVFCIAEQGGVPVGVARADPQQDDLFEISYTVAPEFRGRGIAKAMMRQFIHQYLEGKKLVAIIKKDSFASESVARALGLSPHKPIASTDTSDERVFIEWR